MKITEDYCSYEVAKLLKEKGFDEYCWKFYELGDCGIPVLLNGFDLSEESSFWNNKYLELYKKEHCHINNICSAPTHQLAMKWLREEKNILIYVYPVIDLPVKNNYTFYWKWDGKKKRHDAPHIGDKHNYESFEQAVEAALKYSLENLI